MSNYEEILQPIYDSFSASQLEIVLFAWLPNKIESFYPYLKTNIYSVDTFLITGIVTILVVITKIFHKVLADLWAGRKFADGAISVVVEYNTLDEYGDTVVNKHHQAMSWLISQKAKTKSKGAYIMVPNLEIDYKWDEPPFFNILPQTDVEIDIEHEGRNYKVSFVGANSNSNGENNDNNNNNGNNNQSLSTTKKLPSILICTFDEPVVGEKKGPGSLNVDYMATLLHNVTKDYLAYEKSQRTVVRSRYEYNSSGYWSRTCTLPEINGLQTVALKKEYEELIPKDIETFMNNRDFYRRVGFPYRRGYLLHGRPGTGKTSLVNAIASKMNRDLYFINLKDIKDDSGLLSAFSNIPSNSIVVFEDVDTQTKVLHNRALRSKKESILESIWMSGMTDVAPQKPENTIDKKEKNEKSGGGFGGFGNNLYEAFSLSTMLSVLDGRTLEEGIVFIMTTNHHELLDPAVVRPGRLDIHIDLDYCTHYQINRMYGIVVEDETADLHDIYPEFDKEIPEFTLPPCEVMQMMVLHRNESMLIKEGLIAIAKLYCDGSVWKDDAATLDVTTSLAIAKKENAPPAKEDSAIDLNTIENRTIAVQVNITDQREYGIQAGVDKSIKKLEPRKLTPKPDPATSVSLTSTATETTKTEVPPTSKEASTETEPKTELKTEQAPEPSSPPPSSKGSPVTNGKLVYKAVEEIRKAKLDGKEEDGECNVSEDGFSVVPSPM